MGRSYELRIARPDAVRWDQSDEHQPAVRISNAFGDLTCAGIYQRRGDALAFRRQVQLVALSSVEAWRVSLTLL